MELGIDLSEAIRRTIHDEDVGHDWVNKNGVKNDFKSRSGPKFALEFVHPGDGLIRSLKHNLWARQVHNYNTPLDTDVYILCHLLATPINNKKTGVNKMQGTKRQQKKSWMLYVCGWISKAKAIKHGVYVTRGSISERGASVMTYRGEEIEFLHRNINPIDSFDYLQNLTKEDVKKDSEEVPPFPNITNPDFARVAQDVSSLVIPKARDFVTESLEAVGIKLPKRPVPFIPQNYYDYFIRSMNHAGKMTVEERALILKHYPYSPYLGLGKTSPTTLSSCA